MAIATSSPSLEHEWEFLTGTFTIEGETVRLLVAIEFLPKAQAKQRERLLRGLIEQALKSAVASSGSSALNRAATSTATPNTSLPSPTGTLVGVLASIGIYLFENREWIGQAILGGIIGNRSDAIALKALRRLSIKRAAPPVALDRGVALARAKASLVNAYPEIQDPERLELQHDEMHSNGSWLLVFKCSLDHSNALVLYNRWSYKVVVSPPTAAIQRPSVWKPWRREQVLSFSPELISRTARIE